MNDKSEYFDLMSDRNKIFVVLLSVELGLILVLVNCGVLINLSLRQLQGNKGVEIRGVTNLSV